MKYLIITLLAIFLGNMNANAEDKSCRTDESDTVVTDSYAINTDVPKHLRGASITITLANGKSSTVPAEKFKVVARKQQFITTATKKMVVRTCTTEDSKRHRISVLAGKGTLDGMHRNEDELPNKLEIKNKNGIYGGAQYQFRTGLKVIKLPVSVGVQGATNNSGAVLLGLDF